MGMVGIQPYILVSKLKKIKTRPVRCTGYLNSLKNPSLYIYTEGYSESTEPIDAVNILPLARFEPTTSATPPSTTLDINATKLRH